jgi:hypothetical protein
MSPQRRAEIEAGLAAYRAEFGGLRDATDDELLAWMATIPRDAVIHARAQLASEFIAAAPDIVGELLAELDAITRPPRNTVPLLSPADDVTAS